MRRRAELALVALRLVPTLLSKVPKTVQSGLTVLSDAEMASVASGEVWNHWLAHVTPTLDAPDSLYDQFMALYKLVYTDER